MNKLDLFRVNFTFFWENISSDTRAAVINLVGIFVAVGVLFSLQKIYPAADFSAVQGVVVTAASAWVVSWVKNRTKTE